MSLPLTPPTGATWTRYLLPPAVTAILVILGYIWKASCVLPGEHLGLADLTGRMCLTDIGSLWSARSLADHQFPYIHAVFIPPQGLLGGVEYPALSGILIWLLSLAAGTTLMFLTMNFLALGVCAVAVTVLITRMAGSRAWLWAAAPEILAYVVYNWDSWPVLAATAAIAVLAVSASRHVAPTLPALALAGVLLGVGGALKIYPLLLLLPLVLFVLHAERMHGSSIRRRLARALTPALAAGAVLLAANLPLMLINFDGWLAPIRFQSDRQLRQDTMSIWYWLLRPFGHPQRESIQPAVNVVTLGVTAIAIVAILIVGWRIAEARGSYPFLPVALAVVCAYMVLGKVSSPQYLLWLIPVIAVVAVRVRLVVAIYAVDLVMFVAWFQVNSQRVADPGLSRALDVVVAIAVFARAGLLVLIAIRALRADSPPLPRWNRGPRARIRGTEPAMDGAIA